MAIVSVSVGLCYNATEITIMFYGQIFMKNGKKLKKNSIHNRMTIAYQKKIAITNFMMDLKPSPALHPSMHRTCKLIQQNFDITMK